jgi:hypothetical protein
MWEEDDIFVGYIIRTKIDNEWVTLRYKTLGQFYAMRSELDKDKIPNKTFITSLIEYNDYED